MGEEETVDDDRDPLVVLIVDDSRAMRRIQREVLSRLGSLEILEAEDGVSAVHRMAEREFRVDLVLVDWMMPRMNGLQLVRLLKSNPNLRDVPVLMVTSCTDEHMMGEARRTGVDGYLLKPFTRELFLQAILALAPGSGTEEDSGPDERELRAEDRPFLDTLPEELRRRMLELGIVVDYGPGEAVLREGEHVGYFYYIVSGEVREVQRAVGCAGEIIRSYGPGECFGVTELVSGDAPASRFEAAGPSRVGRLPRAAFESMLLKHPEVGVSLSRVLAGKARRLEVQDPGGTADLSGALQVLDLPALVQAVSLRQRSCVIELPGLDAEIGFLHGQVVSVRCGEQEGKEAFLEILEHEPGSLHLAARPAEGPRNVHEPTARLLLEAARRLDERTA